MLDRGPKGTAESLHALDRLLTLDAEDAGALELKGIILFRGGRVDEARPLFAHAATAGPVSAASHVGLATARRDGREPDAIAEFEIAWRIEPGDPWILDRLRDAYLRAGDTAHAGDVERARTYFSPRPGYGPSPATRWLPEGWR